MLEKLREALTHIEHVTGNRRGEALDVRLVGNRLSVTLLEPSEFAASLKIAIAELERRGRILRG